MKVEYSSNNSGGSWWLKKEDWLNLEKAGWFVEWGGLKFCYAKHSYLKKDPICRKDQECPGHRASETMDGVKDPFLGAYAISAWKEFKSLKEGILEFEKITGKDATDEGCNCCGPPHSFSADQEYASGENIVAILYGNDSPKTLREAAERLKK